ncbi:glycine betaine ABC transporter substrate-binding protein [Demequina sp. NBRC 110055]|uniref:glycine betaine ABC transporter substrate-binding protein n=1 Tax=Demequina sp. NBRC 110055 TaxID=1570344 RepID=UPI000A01839B|nr:glycine betaine ABC transporter substrate-binding protein [Demequina sp. NBRC 110055]
MHTRPYTLRPYTLAALAVASLALTACSSGGTDEESPTAGTSDAPATSESATAGTGATAQECLPVPGEQLVVLEDDMMLQNSDNIIPALNADAASQDVLDVLAAVSGALDTPTLIELNKSVDIDRQTSEEVAEAWVEQAALDIAESGDGSLTIGAANFSENITLAEIYADALDMAGYDTEVREIGNRETYLPALESGEIDIVPEYAATFTEFLEGDVETAVASGDITETVAALEPLAEERGLVVGEPAEAQDQNAFAVTQGFVDQYGVTTLSQLAESCGGIVLGGPPECPERPFCQPGLEDTYGIEVAEFRSLDAGGPLTKNAITTGEIALGLVFSSDGALATS